MTTEASLRVVCPICHKSVRVRRYGTLHKHGYKNNVREKADHKASRCLGSGKTLDYFIERAKTD
jgi:hypothetical protein